MGSIIGILQLWLMREFGPIANLPSYPLIQQKMIMILISTVPGLASREDLRVKNQVAFGERKHSVQQLSAARQRQELLLCLVMVIITTTITTTERRRCLWVSRLMWREGNLVRIILKCFEQSLRHNSLTALHHLSSERMDLIALEKTIQISLRMIQTITQPQYLTLKRRQIVSRRSAPLLQNQDPHRHHRLFLLAHLSSNRLTRRNEDHHDLLHPLLLPIPLLLFLLHILLLLLASLSLLSLLQSLKMRILWSGPGNRSRGI
jgi:hypothetical protein